MSCSCLLTSDSECPVCRGRIFKAFLDAGLLYRKFIEDMNALVERLKGTCACDDCARRYIDPAIANLLANVLAEAPNRDLAAKMMQWSISMIHGMGIAAIPQTLKAWKELCWRRGWSEEIV